MPTTPNSPKSISIDGTIVSAAVATDDASVEEEFDLCPITGKNLSSSSKDDTLPTPVAAIPKNNSRPTTATAAAPKLPAAAAVAVQPPVQPQILTDQKLMQFNEDGSPVLVRGDDGTIYRVGGHNEHGQTILIPQLDVKEKSSPTKMMSPLQEV